MASVLNTPPNAAYSDAFRLMDVRPSANNPQNFGDIAAGINSFSALISKGYYGPKAYPADSLVKISDKVKGQQIHGFKKGGAIPDQTDLASAIFIRGFVNGAGGQKRLYYSMARETTPKEEGAIYKHTPSLEDRRIYVISFESFRSRSKAVVRIPIAAAEKIYSMRFGSFLSGVNGEALKVGKEIVQLYQGNASVAAKALIAISEAAKHYSQDGITMPSAIRSTWREIVVDTGTGETMGQYISRMSTESTPSSSSLKIDLSEIEIVDTDYSIRGLPSDTFANLSASIATAQTIVVSGSFGPSAYSSNPFKVSFQHNENPVFGFPPKSAKKRSKTVPAFVIGAEEVNGKEFVFYKVARDVTGDQGGPANILGHNGSAVRGYYPTDDMQTYTMSFKSFAERSIEDLYLGAMHTSTLYGMTDREILGDKKTEVRAYGEDIYRTYSEKKGRNSAGLEALVRFCDASRLLSPYNIHGALSRAWDGIGEGSDRFMA